MTTRLGRLSEVPVSNAAYGLHPERFAGRHEARLTTLAGLTQFGVNHVTLEPGAHSSLRHWHEGEDEFVYVLSGDLILIDEAGEHSLQAGDFAGFPAGEVNAHHLVNRSQAPAVFLAVGRRLPGAETVHYPDDPLGPITVVRDDKGRRVG